jgi:hypothetical protein
MNDFHPFPLSAVLMFELAKSVPEKKLIKYQIVIDKPV